MATLDFFGALALGILERDKPLLIKRLDELTDLEMAGCLSHQERIELTRLDGQLLREYDRIRIHYRVNWDQGMDAKVKADLTELGQAVLSRSHGRAKS